MPWLIISIFICFTFKAWKHFTGVCVAAQCWILLPNLLMFEYIFILLICGCLLGDFIHNVSNFAFLIFKPFFVRPRKNSLLSPAHHSEHEKSSCLFYLYMVDMMDVTSFRQSFAIDLKDRITPMMVILFSTFSPPGSANERHESCC